MKRVIISSSSNRTSKYVTFDELMKLAMQHYNEGGDGIVECWDEDTFNRYVEEVGPMTRKDALDLVLLRQ